MTGTPGEGAFDVSRVQGILCSNEELGARLAGILVKSEIPAVCSVREDGRAVVAVPAERGTQAVNILLSLKGIVLDRSSEPFLRPYDAVKDDVLFDHPVLGLSSEAIRARGAEALDELEACVTRGNSPVAKRAMTILQRLGQDAWPCLDKLVLSAIRKGDAPMAGMLLRSGRGAEGRTESGLPPSLAELTELARHPESAVRQLSLRTLAAIRAFDTVPVLAEALLDEDPEVAIEADDAFLTWGGDDLGFDPELDTASKKAISEKRRAFRPTRA